MKFDVSIEIDAAPAIVWGVLSDAERWSEWTPTVTGIRLLDPGPLAVGTRALIRQPKFPPAVWRVSEIEEGRSFTWITGSPGVRVSAHHRVDPSDGGSRATLSLSFDGILGPLVGRITGKLNERYLRTEAEGLRRRSEERQRAAAAAEVPSD